MNGSYIHTLLEARNGKVQEDIDRKFAELIADGIGREVINQ